MNTMTGKNISVVVWGVVHGVILVGLSSLCAGVGNGTYIPLIMSASPLPLLPVYWVAITASPLLWGGLVFLSVNSYGAIRKIFAVLNAVRYIAAIYLLFFSRYGGQLSGSQPGSFGAPFMAWIVLYLCGECAIWYFFARNRDKRADFPGTAVDARS